MKEHIRSNISDATNTFCESLTTIRVQKCVKSENIAYFGSGNVVEHDIALKCNISVSSAKTYNRIMKCGCLYTSCLLQNNRSNNSYAQLIDGKYIKIISFILDIDSNIALTICNKINAISYNENSYLCKIIDIDKDLCIIETKNIDRICVYINIKDDAYIAAVPNLLFY